MVTEHLAKVPLGALDERSTGAVKTVLNEDIEKLELFLAHNLPEFVAYLTGPVAIFFYLLSVNVPLALVSLLPLPLAGIVMGVIFGRMKGILEDANRSLVSFNSVMIEYVSGMRLIKAYNMGSRSFQKFSHAISEENRIWNLVTHKTAPPYAAFLLLVECGMLLMIPAGGLLFLRGSVSASVFLLFAYVGGMYLTEILPLQKMSTTFAQALSGVGKVREILELPVFEGGGPFPEDRGIELDHVTFSYDGKRPILQGVDLTIAPGSLTAVVGESGCGKSTLSALLMGRNKGYGGHITLGGAELSSLSEDSLMAHCTYVGHRSHLFKGTVRDNLLLARPDALDEQLWAVLEQVNLASFLRGERGLDTQLQEGGNNFSGGQRQRLALARALLHDSPMYIFDEATSNVDVESENEIMAQIRQLSRTHTVLVISHRLANVAGADVIYTMDQGRVAEHGSHAQLLQHNGVYARLWRQQQELESYNQEEVPA